MNNNYGNRSNRNRQQAPQNRQYSGMPYPPVRHKSRNQANKAKALVLVSAVILALLVISVIIFVSRCGSDSITVDNNTQSDYSDLTNDSGTSDTNTGTDSGEYIDTSDTNNDTETTQNVPVLDPGYTYVTKTQADIYKGYQILINGDYAYDFEAAPAMATLFANKNGVFKVNNTTDSLEKTALAAFVEMMKAFSMETGNSDIIVTSADRSVETQKSIWDSRVNTYGEEYARLYVAEPGHSEHHSGLALDLAIYTDDGKTYKFDEKPEYSEWLTSNAHRFGFVERYRADKTDITKIAYENWHYRYIGIPHAYYMTENNLCLEEYIEYVRTLIFGEKSLLITNDEGMAWEVYFVPASPEGETDVPVPASGAYEISGNNIDGFIVTVEK